MPTAMLVSGETRELLCSLAVGVKTSAFATGESLIAGLEVPAAVHSSDERLVRVAVTNSTGAGIAFDVGDRIASVEPLPESDMFLVDRIPCEVRAQMCSEDSDLADHIAKLSKKIEVDRPLFAQGGGGGARSEKKFSETCAAAQGAHTRASAARPSSSRCPRSHCRRRRSMRRLHLPLRRLQLPRAQPWPWPWPWQRSRRPWLWPSQSSCQRPCRRPAPPWTASASWLSICP